MKRILAILVGSLLIAFSFNYFLIPSGILSAGVSGLAILLSFVTPFDTGLLNFVLNIPILILGYIKLGKDITVNTMIVVVALSILLSVIPSEQLADDLLLSSIFGGVIVGTGIGLILRYAGTSGGFDIIAILISQTTQLSVGLWLTAMNAVIVLISGIIFGAEIALYTMISIYITGRAIDTIHTNHIKLTMQIVTTEGEAIRKELIDTVYRGMTLSKGYGGYTMEEKDLLMMVVTRYETMLIKQIIRKHDPSAFINIYKTVDVDGEFANN
ncbi:Uncharacterized membrane-anchored protein YitT, contains DUF161 and DUF2179 domains [Pelagirhabdus alkalitolerans]|uniref:Uncharacterized membrane-anchored protein YitT, contains DUF161 and DUF2179 domains n=1 Tax=Pelagirhabdus alkalitolerans TaxID=1612202 RepID=A0A1G6H8I3_9BACI|nr:YitT family protein [Pelagirhabdus alkalitolerans]SDB90255.1 Uncharacterized membrane-anchored protein YitT, contains DUF161 and DUF2179 domains [Pelagirhabdus alkalitolerans]